MICEFKLSPTGSTVMKTPQKVSVHICLSPNGKNRARNHFDSDSSRNHVNKAKTSISELDMYCPISDSTVVEFCTKLSSGRK